MDKKLPLQVFFIWHVSDTETAEPIAEYCFSLLSRDTSAPFSHAMNLPVFFLRCIGNGTPELPSFDTEKTLIFLFCSFHVAGDSAWVKYLKENFVNPDKGVEVIPIALDKDSLSLSRILSNVNFIRATDYGTPINKEWVFITVAHEIYRRALLPHPSGENSRLRIFLSHKKEENGEKIAQHVKSFIYRNTYMQNFFDTTDILPGTKFDEEIEKAIPGSTFLAIQSDGYSASYWCQKEILLAKRSHIPILVLDVLEKGEDRGFPFLSNTPVLRIKDSTSDEDILFVLSRVILETVRFRYIERLLSVQMKWYGIKNAYPSGRVPEMMDSIRDGAPSALYYSEPVVYPEEKKILEKSFKKVGTIEEAWVPAIGKTIGISISDPSEEELVKAGISQKHLKLLSQNLARNLLIRQAKLLYGGDLRKGGFTEFLFEEARVLQSRLKTNEIYLYNYLSWPIYHADDEETIRWKGNCIEIAEMKDIPPAEDVQDLIPDTEKFLSKGTKENRYVWSRCLTRMREELIQKSDIRISVGGHCEGYSGQMPGILEEVLLSIEKRRPVFLLGGFGGITKYICDAIQTGSIPNELTYDWQEKHNAGYRELRESYQKRAQNFIEYSSLKDRLTFKNLHNGLTHKENERLFYTKFGEEALYLILKGIENCIGKKS